VRGILSAHENRDPGTSLPAILRLLYHLNAEVYNIDSVIGVFFQVLRSRESLRALRLPWTTIQPGWRQWNMYCQTYRSHPEATVCVPHLELSITGFNPPFSISHGPWSKRDNSISVHLNADIRTSILNELQSDENTTPEVTELSSNGRIQKIVDDILCAMVAVTMRVAIKDPADLVGRLSNAITAYLKNSELRSHVEFKSIEIILANSSRARYVSSVLLNSDGSERDGRLDEQVDHRTDIDIHGGSRIDGFVL
jgi:hypothetical protein